MAKKKGNKITPKSMVTTARDLNAIALASATDLAANAAKMASDLATNAVEVKAELASHERVCSERYGFILKEIEGLRSAMFDNNAAMKLQIAENNAGMIGRTSVLSNRMWMIVVGLVGSLILGLAATIMLLVVILKHA